MTKAWSLAAALLLGACAPPPAAPRPADDAPPAELYFYKVIHIFSWRGRFYGVPIAELPPNGHARGARLEAEGYAHCFAGRTSAEVKDAVRRYVLADNLVPELVWR